MGWAICPEVYGGNLIMVHGNTAPVRKATNLLDDNICVWTDITNGYGNCEIHVDQHYMTFTDFPNIWVGNDGGVYTATVRNDENWEWIEKNNGLAVATCYRVGNSDLDKAVMTSGQHDCGSNFYSKNNGIWNSQHVRGGDGFQTIITDDEPISFYVSSQDGGLFKSNDYFNNYQSCNVPSWFDTFYENEPGNPNVLYSTFSSGLYKVTNCSTTLSWSNYGYQPTGQDTWTVSISKSNPDYIYTSWFDNDQNYNFYQRVYKSMTGGGPNENDWTLVGSPPEDEWITSIAIDERNPDHIWVTTGWRIYSIYTENPNPEWVLFMPGFDLWKINFNKIVYLNGSIKDELYVGTSLGTYYINNELAEWENISVNLPNVEVRDIEINYTNNSIAVATFGRGVWEASLSCGLDVNTLFISDEYIDWPDYYRIFSNIQILPGKTLNISGKVEFGQESKIIVERGGHLIIDGGTLTNACDGMWKGVEVWGTANQTQSELYQGVVEVINGGIIENAICGIQTIKMSLPEGGGETPDYYFTGGIVTCDEGIFKNNKTAVKFWPYNQSPSVSYFRECDFITNDDLIAGTDVEYFIDMSGISGIHILGNSFNDEHFFEEPDELTTGIYAYNSQFYVLPQAGQPNIFSRLYYGIKALATNPVTTLEIENNQFTNNLRSVYLSATNNAHVNLNVFNPWTELLLDPSESYCMYLDHCTGYQVEQNTFTNEVGTHKGIGLIVNQSGSVDNMVYLNYFNNLLYGAIAQNENRNKAGTLGLQFKCNEFTENASDLSVTYLPPKTKSTGIAASQGSGLPSPSAPAGNLFSWTGPQGTPTDINNEAQHVTYYYHNTAPTYKLQPLYYSPLTVSPQGVSAPYNEESCPPDFEGGGGGGGSRETMALAEQKADSLQEIISSLEDGGNTIELKEDVEWSIPPESMVVYNELMNNSPYLTDTVITAAIEKEDVLVNAMIRDVMVANPQSAKDDELIEKLEERNNPVPEYMLGEILQGRNLVSVYEELQSKLSFYTQQRSFTFHSLVYSYLTDTINPGASADSLTVLFNNERTPEAKYSLAFLSMEQGAWSEGLDILNQVSTQFILTEEQQAEQQHLVELCTLLSGLNSTLPDSIQLNELNEIESANAGTGSVYARNILLTLNEIEYNEPVILPGVLKSSEAEKYEQYLQSASEMKYLEVFPNPVQDHVIISWKLNTSTDVKIKITDNTGKNISEIAVNSSENQQVFDTHNLKPGVYIATLIVNGKQTDSAKFTLIK